jgi:hypothetical protein
MDPGEAYRTMPVLTKVLLTGSFVVTLAANFGLVNPYALLINWDPIWNNFHVSQSVCLCPACLVYLCLSVCLFVCLRVCVAAVRSEEFVIIRF